MNDQLDPCPFCEAQPELHSHKISRGRRVYQYICPNSCAATHEHPTPEGAKLDWNRRPIESKLRNEIEQLKMRYAELRALINDVY